VNKIFFQRKIEHLRTNVLLSAVTYLKKFKMVDQIWRTEFQKPFNSNESQCLGLLDVADYEFHVAILKFKMADATWSLEMQKYTQCG